MQNLSHMTASALTNLLRKSSRAVIALLLLNSLLSFASAQEVNSQEQAIFNFMNNHPGQRRAFLELDPILSRVARAKAADMAARGYFDHVDPNGRGANTLVRNAGYVLPAGYSTALGANNLESLSAGRSTASQTWNDWLGSPGHRLHLLGEAGFFAAQTSVGVGYVNAPGSQYQWYWVVITAPPSGPQLVTSLRNGTEVNDASLAVSGSTGGDPAAASVQVRVENANGEGAWIAASGVAAWTANVTGLVAGENTIRFQSLSATGEVLRDIVRTVRYVVLAPVTIAVAGEGTVSGDFAGTTQREVSRSFTVTATPKPGSIFAGWTGGATALTRALTFTVPDGGITITATFIPNPFPAGAGGYTGLFTGTDGTRGALNLSLTGNGSFTGRLRLGGEVLVIKGRFDAEGAAEVTATSASGAAYTLTLHYADSSISGTIAGNGLSADLSLDSLSKPTTAPNVNAGRYTLAIAAPVDAGAQIPAGDSIAMVNVTPAGAATVTGALADGTPFTTRSRVTKNGTLIVFAPLYRGAGLVSSTLTFRALETSDVDGPLFWSRPAQQEAVSFPAGFAIETSALGSRYTAPRGNQPIVPVSTGANNAALALGDGGLAAPVVQTATLTPSNTLTITTPAVTGLTAKINPVRGDFSGRFVHPQTGAVTKIRGVILQKRGAGFGFFTGGSDAGYATFAPTGAEASLAE